MIQPVRRLDVQVGVNPILWSNDDFHDLGGDIPLERCLAEMHAAGYAGTELGHKYPRDARALLALLRQHELRVVSGWHSLFLLDGDPEEELRRFTGQVDLLEALSAPVAIVAECSGQTYGDPLVPLRFDRGARALDGAGWERLGRALQEMAALARARGLRLAYHHHMGTVVQTRAEIDELLARAPDVGLLLDTGHLALAGVDPVATLRDHAARVVHVHLKDVRLQLAQRARAERMSFAQAVRAGVFTVPGDGSVDFRGIFEQLARVGYRGWVVVEADQDPARQPPLHYARMGREYLRRSIGV
jgi:inosose dehydratase